MKKLYAVLLVLMLFFAACGDEPTNGVNLSGDNMDLVPANLQKLMTSGDQIISDTVDAYGIADPEINETIKLYADYTLFPVDFESGYTLQDRMKGFLGGDNNLINAYTMMENISNGLPLGSGIESPLPRHLGARKISLGKIGKILKIAAPFVDCICPGAGQICSAVGKGMIAYDNAQKKQKAEQQIAAIGKTLDAFVTESRAMFKALDTKVDAVMSLVNTVIGDISWMHSALIGQSYRDDMNYVKIDYDSFLQTVSIGTVFDASNTIYNYFITSGKYTQDLNKLIYCATNVQKWSIDPANTNTSGYTEWMRHDPNITTNYFFAEADFAAGSTYVYSQLDYPNVKRMVAISIGDLDYLAKMMLDRISMQSFIYSGSTLSNQNRVVASALRAKLAPIKAAAIAAYNNLLSEYQRYYGMHAGNIGWDTVVDANGAELFGFPYPGYLGATTQMWCGYKYPASIKAVVNYSGGVSGATQLEKGDFICTTIKPTLLLAYESAMNEYFAHYMARLVALETMLKSYE